MRLPIRRAFVAAAVLSFPTTLAGCVHPEAGASAAAGTPGEGDKVAAQAREPAGEPFAKLPAPTPDPAATPYRFETGPRVPKPENVVDVPFPPPSTPAAAKTPVPPELAVVRKQPEGTGKGNEGLIGAVTVTFNQPMVPLAALEDLRAENVPLVIEPKVPGRFRWLGTTTVTFEPEGRMPMATSYTARVPAGVKSALGKTLAKEVSWKFETPRPTVVTQFPLKGSSHATPDTVFGVAFDQKMDPARTAAAITVKNSAGTRILMEPVPPSEWSSIKGAPVGKWDPERSVVLRPKEPLPKDRRFTAQVASGLRGAEGPLATKSKTTWAFKTYAPLKVVDVRCSWEDRPCLPGQPWNVEFNNALSAEPLEKKVSFVPGLEGEMEVYNYGGQTISIAGAFAPVTTYELTLDASITDVYGQTLGKPYVTTRKTGDAPPTMDLPAHGLALSEAKGNRTVALGVMNVFNARVRMVKVSKKDVPKFLKLARRSPWFDDYYESRSKDPLAGVKGIVVNRKLDLPKKRNEAARVGIPIDEAVKGAPGIVYLDLFSQDLRKLDRHAPRYRGLLVQVTDIGLAVKYDPFQIVVLALEIETGKPMEGVDVEIVEEGGKTWWSGKTGADGMARAPGVRERAIGDPPLYLFGTKGDDLAFVEVNGATEHGWVPGYNYSQTFQEHSLRSQLFTDRGIYRPEETVHLKGILRSYLNRPGGAISALPEGSKKLTWSVRGPRGDEMSKGEGELSEFGTFVLDIPVPRGADLGTYRVYATPVNAGDVAGTATGTFQIEEYRAPEYKVSVDTGAGPWIFDQTLAATINGAYYFGAPMADAEVSWTLARAPGVYSPPGNEGFAFGERTWRPWSWEMEYDHSPRRRGYSYRTRAPDANAAEGTGRLDASGNLAVSAKLERGPIEKGPGSFTLEATVFDKNRQSVSGRSTFVVHPASVYVGLRSAKAVVREKERAPIDVVAAAIDGARVATKVDLVVLEQKWKNKATQAPDGTWTTKWEAVETEITRCSVDTGKEPKPCEVTPPRAGYFLVRASAKDAEGRTATTTIDLYVYGTGQVSWRTENANRVELVPDKQEYQVGDVAKILVKSPFPRAEGLVSWEAEGMLEAKRLTLEGSAVALEVPITEKHIPNLHVGIAIARGRLSPAELPEGAGKAEDLGRPSYAHGATNLKVSAAPKTLTVKATASKATAEPQEKIAVEVSIADAAGKPVKGEVAVMLVDEGVLALLGYETPDPVAAFWRTRQPGTALADVRAFLLKRETDLKLALLQKAQKKNGGGSTGRGAPGLRLLEANAAPGDAEPARRERAAAADESDKEYKSDDAGGEAFAARTEFASTAFWAGSVVTGADGKATVDVKLPDNLTTFRVMAVAVDSGDRFGHGDSQVTVRKRLLVRPSLPRFLNFGDRFEAAMVVHNETGKDGQVELIARGASVTFLDPQRKAIFLKSGQSSEVRWNVKATKTGPARIQFGASFAGATDAAELTVPVKLPATGEAFATYGTTESSIAQPVLLPANAIPEFGALEVQTSSTALTTLGDAVDYLYDYPYECVEQTASRILAVFALKDVIKDFKLGDEDSNAKAERIGKDGIKRLVSLQHWDGGFKFWPGSPNTDPWASGWATFALLRGKEAGYEVPATTLERAKRYLLNQGLNPPKEWGEYWRRAVKAQSLMVLTEMGQTKGQVATVADELYGVRSELPFFTRAELLVSLYRIAGNKRDAKVNELLRLIDNAAVETPSAAHFAEVRTESLKLLMHSESRTDAIVLWSLIQVRRDDPLIPKVVKGLDAGRVKGRWSTTNENAWVLLAMSRYYKTFEKTVPEFTANAWLEDQFMGSATFSGRTMDVKELKAPLETFAKELGQTKTLVLAKDGPGRMYYRLGLKYAPTDLVLKPEEQGFSLTRVYEPVDDAADVLKEADGTWVIKAGSTVRVRMTIVVPDRRYYAAIVDPLPAGLEAVNTRLETSSRNRASGSLDNVSSTWSWYAYWVFNHVQMRDDRVEVFANQLPPGVYEYTYLARATTLGDFVVPPLKAEEMYAPEVFGRNGTARVSIR